MKQTLFILIAVVCLTACKRNGYETGDGELSYLRADFVLLYTTGAKQVMTAVTDDGDTLRFSPPMQCDWADKADTLFRALLYYKNFPNGRQPLTAVAVPVLQPLAHVSNMVTDPVTFESAWIGSNGKYLNIGIALMTASSDDNTEKQSVGMALTKVEKHANAHTTYHLTLLHGQNSVPQYYSTRAYLSVPLSNYQHGDTVHLSINTYNGVVKKEFAI